MPRCILHVGGEATGARTIQRTLQARREALFADGLIVPAAGVEQRSGRHRPLLLALCGWPSLPQRASDAPGELSALLAANPDHDVVLSCESLEHHFGATRSPVVAFFAERGYRVELVVYVRPQEERIDLAYAARTAALYGLHRWRDVLAHQVAGNVLMASRWLDAGAEHGVAVACRPFVAGGDVAGDFLRTVGHDPCGAAVPAQAEGASALAVAVAQAIMTALAARDIVPTPRQRMAIADQLAELAAEYDGAPFHGFSDEELYHVRRHFRGDNEHFARAAWGRSWDEMFSPDAASAASAAPARGSDEAHEEDRRTLLAAMMPYVEDALADPALAAQPFVTEYPERSLRGIGRLFAAEDAFPPTPDNVLRT